MIGIRKTSKLKMLGLLPLLLSAPNSQANVQYDFYLPHFYVGADAQVQRMPFKRDFGGNIFKNNYPGGNFYFGLRASEHFGMEAGYEMAKTRTHSVVLPQNSVFFGVPLPYEQLHLNYVLRTRGFHTSLIGFLPLWEKNKQSLSLLAAVGIMNIRIKASTLITQVTQVETVPTSLGLILSGSKNVLRLMTGLQYMFTYNFGARANIRWVNTARINDIDPVREFSPEKAKAKNSIIYGLGVMFSF